MKWQITFRKYVRQAAGLLSMALVFALSAKLLLPPEADGVAGKTFLLPPTQVGTDLQKKPDHARVGISAECFELLLASGEKWVKSSGGTVWEIHTFGLLPFFVPEAVQDVIIFVYRTILIYILNCCYRI